MVLKTFHWIKFSCLRKTVDNRRMSQYEDNMQDLNDSEGNKPLELIKRKIQQLWFPVFSACVVFAICSIIIIITFLTYRPLSPQAQYNIAILGAWVNLNQKKKKKIKKKKYIF